MSNNLIKKTGNGILPYLVISGIALSGCSKDKAKKKDCFVYYDMLVGSQGLVDKNQDGVLDLEEQADFMRALGHDRLMTGSNFPEIFTNKAEFRSHLNSTLYLDEVHAGLKNAFSLYYNEKYHEEIKYGGR